MVVARRGAFVDDLADDFQRGASMMKSTRDIERGFLQRAINAPRRRAGRAFAVVSAVPRRSGRENGRRLSHDLLVECVWPHFVGGVEIETQRRGRCELGDCEPAVYRPENTPTARIDLKLERIIRIAFVGHIARPNRRRVSIVTPNSSGDPPGSETHSAKVGVRFQHTQLMPARSKT
jgi:hypothetical protein